MTFRRLLGFLRPYRVQVIASCILAVGSQVVGLTIPYLTGEVINALPPGGETRTRVYELSALIVLAGALKGILTYFRRQLAGRLSLAVDFDLRNAMYSHLQRLSYSFYDRHQTGQLMSRATVDLQLVRIFLGYGLIFFSQNFMTVFVVVIALALIDWQLALVAMAISPVLAYSAYRYSRRSQPVVKDVQQKIADVTTIAEENIVGVRVVKAFAQEPTQQGHFSVATERVFSRSMDAAKLAATYIPFMSALPSLGIAAVVLLGGHKVIDGDMSLGAFFAANGYMLMLSAPLRGVGMLVGQYQRAIAAGDRVFEVLDAERDLVEQPGAAPLPDGPGRISFDHVQFGYDETRPVLHDVNLEVAAGSTVALIGPTGCGKTTLTTLIPRFYDVAGGSVSVDGADVRSLTLDSLRQQVGIVSQDTFLFSTTVAENIAYGAAWATPEQIVQAARQAQAHEFICDLPDGYETRVGERGLTLSGGQRQRIAIARALLMNPRILILDDATASVDASTEARIKLALREVMKGRTTLIIAHRLSTISMADRVVVLDHGRIVGDGVHDELIASSEVYRQIHQYGLVDRTFVALDPDGAPIEKDGDPPAPRAAGGRLP